MALTNLTSFPSLLRPDAAEVFGDWYVYPDLWKEIFKVFHSDKAVEYEILMEGLPIAQLKPDGSPSAQGQLRQAYQSRYVNQYYAMSFTITRAAILDNQYQSQFPQQAMQLRNSLQTLKNVNSMFLFNNAFNANSVGGDGVQLCSTEHPITGGVQANTFTNGVGFNEAAVEAAITLVKSWKNQAGLTLDTRTIKALVPQKLGFQAARIFKSQLQPDSTSHNVNAILTDKYMTGGYLVNQFLTSPYNWFILTSNDHGFKHYLRENLDIDFIVDTLTDNVTVRALERYSYGYSNWRGAWGSQGM